MKMDVDNTILESLLERPEEWEFDDDPTRCYIKHKKSKFELAFHVIPKIWAPDWAKLHVFDKDNRALIKKAILSLREERSAIASSAVDDRILKMLEPEQLEPEQLGPLGDDPLGDDEGPVKRTLMALVIVFMVAALPCFIYLTW